MIIRMELDRYINNYMYEAGEEYETPFDIEESHAKTFISDGAAVIVLPEMFWEC